MDQNKIDTLIKAGWRVLNTYFSEKAFNDWRKEALECVVALCGESHPYKEYFQNNVQKDLTTSVLTGVGLLTAAQSRGEAPNS